VRRNPAKSDSGGACAAVESSHRRVGACVWWVALLGVVMSLAAPVAAGGHYAHSKFSYDDPNDDKKVDPVTFVGYGVDVTAEAAEDIVSDHTNWEPRAFGNQGQFGKDHSVWTEFDSNNADGLNTSTRNHVRWNASEAEGLGHDNYIYVAGTPHHEVWTTEGPCPDTGTHATDSYVQAREELRTDLLAAHNYPWFYRYDGSQTPTMQCNEDKVASDGSVVWMRLLPEPALAASRPASDGSVPVDAEPVALTQAIGRACESDDVPDFDHYFVGSEFDGLSLTVVTGPASRRRRWSAPTRACPSTSVRSASIISSTPMATAPCRRRPRVAAFRRFRSFPRPAVNARIRSIGVTRVRPS
jgi:hypothetical protein